MLRLGAAKDKLRIVDDQVGAPTSAKAIARATDRVLREYNPQGKFPVGLYHMTAEGEVSWAGFAREIFRLAKPEHMPVIEPILSEGYPTPARRPKNSRLSNHKFGRTFGFHLPHWQEQLQETISELREEEGHRR